MRAKLILIIYGVWSFFIILFRAILGLVSHTDCMGSSGILTVLYAIYKVIETLLRLFAYCRVKKRYSSRKEAKYI